MLRIAYKSIEKTGMTKIFNTNDNASLEYYYKDVPECGFYFKFTDVENNVHYIKPEQLSYIGQFTDKNSTRFNFLYR